MTRAWIFTGLFSLRWAALRFHARQRHEYYDYLADILQATQGRKTLSHILLNDAGRYGHTTARGRLSQHWAHQLEEYGDVALAFDGTLPAREVAMIAMLQSLGGQALVSGLRDLSALLRLERHISHLMLNTLSMGYAALLMCLCTLLAICWFTVPTLLGAFNQVAPDMYGSATRRLVGFADWLDNWLWALLILLPAGAVALKCLLPRWHGPTRGLLDRLLPGFTLYRDTQAIRFLVALSTILQPRTGRNHSLAQALALLHDHSPPWLQAHLSQMALRLSDAQAGASVFRTGLLDAQTYWYLEDLVDALGMDAALLKTRQRLEGSTLNALAWRAVMARWLMIGLALTFLLSTMLWHYAVIHEMRAALLLVY